MALLSMIMVCSLSAFDFVGNYDCANGMKVSLKADGTAKITGSDNRTGYWQDRETYALIIQKNIYIQRVAGVSGFEYKFSDDSKCFRWK